ncbi:MAG: EF-hand domain-containing protein [bacterium]
MRHIQGIAGAVFAAVVASSPVAVMSEEAADTPIRCAGGACPSAYSSSEASSNANPVSAVCPAADKCDTNGDGQISDAERNAAQGAWKSQAEEGRKVMLSTFDKDGNGVLSDEEKASMHEAKTAEMQKRIAEFDKDKDGKLSDEERKAMREARRAEAAKRMLARFDTDGDGKLSDEEKAAMASMRLVRQGQAGPVNSSTNGCPLGAQVTVPAAVAPKQ